MVKVNGKLGTQIFFNVDKDDEGILAYTLFIESTNPREGFKETIANRPGSGKKNHIFINVKPNLEFKISLIQYTYEKRNFYRTDYRFITSPEYF
ncbi:unnamed protein product [Gordionus sp. m RMFG-2023]